MKPPVKRTTLLHQLRKEITEGVYPNGTRLPIEREFCRQLGVARETLRGALKILEKENYIERIIGQGTYVRYGDSRELFFLIPCPDYFIRSNYTTRQATGKILSGCLTQSHLLNFHVVPLSISRTNNQQEIDWNALRQLPEHARVVFYSNWFYPVYPLLHEKKCRVMMVRNVWKNLPAEQEYPDQWASCYLDEYSAFASNVELLYASGCRKIMVTSEHLDNPENPRKAGYVEGLRRCGLDTESTMTCATLFCSGNPRSFKQCIRDLYDKYRFDGLLIALPDTLSIDYRKTLNGNLGIPEEVRIITEFDYEYNNSLSRPVTSYSYDFQEVGETLSRFLFTEQYHQEKFTFHHFYNNREALCS